MALIFSLLIRSVIRTSNGMTGMISYLADLGAQKDGEDASIASFSAGVGQCRALCVHIYIYVYFSVSYSLRITFLWHFFFFFYPFCFCFDFVFVQLARKNLYIYPSLFLSFIRQFLSIYTSWNTVCIKYTCIYIYTYTVHATCALTPSCVSVWYICYTLDTTPVNVLSKVWIMRSER